MAEVPWWLVPALQQLRAQLNAMFPGRDRLSDGAVGDTAHSARVSDHNPARDSVPPGAVRALDIDEDLWGRNVKDPGAVAQALADAIVTDPRVAYVIYEGRIAIRNAKTGRVVWSKYSGTNAHRAHIHVSLRHGRVFEQDTSPWPMPGAIGVIRPGIGADITPITPEQSEEDDMAAPTAEEIATAVLDRLIPKPDGSFGKTHELIAFANVDSKESRRVSQATWELVAGLVATDAETRKFLEKRFADVGSHIELYGNWIAGIVRGGGGDPLAVADAIVEKLGPELGQQVVDALAVRLKG